MKKNIGFVFLFVMLLTTACHGQTLFSEPRSSNWRGAWNSATSYARGDGATYSGNSYVCTVANTNQTPSSSSADWIQVGTWLPGIYSDALGDLIASTMVKAPEFCLGSSCVSTWPVGGAMLFPAGTGLMVVSGGNSYGATIPMDGSGNLTFPAGVNIPGNLTAANLGANGNSHSDSLLTGKNLLPDSVFSADQYNNPMYWSMTYPSGVTTGWYAIGVAISSGGSGYTYNSATNGWQYGIATSGGSGSGLLLNIQVSSTGVITAAGVYNGGSGYKNGDAVTVMGVGGSGATLTLAYSLELAGTGSPQSGYWVESPVFRLPPSSSSYAITLSYAANLSHSTGGPVSLELCTTNGQANTVGTVYCASAPTSGTSGSYTVNCTVPGNVGTMVLAINSNGITTTSGYNAILSSPQVEIGSSATVYEPTVGYNNFYSGTAGSVASITGGPVLWPQMQTFLPQTAMGTLSASSQTTGQAQDPQTQSTSPQLILSNAKVSGAPTPSQLVFNFGCTPYHTCEHLPDNTAWSAPGLPVTSSMQCHGTVEVQCYGVTTGGSLTAQIQLKSLNSLSAWEQFQGCGINTAVVPIAVNSGTVRYYLPVQVASTGYAPNADFGEYDIASWVSSTLAPAGACQVTAASLDCTITPTDSTVAGTMNMQSYGDRSHLVH